MHIWYIYIYTYVYIYIQYKHIIYVHLLVEKLTGRADCIAGQKGMATSLRKRYKQPFSSGKLSSAGRSAYGGLKRKATASDHGLKEKSNGRRFSPFAQWSSVFLHKCRKSWYEDSIISRFWRKSMPAVKLSSRITPPTSSNGRYTPMSGLEFGGPGSHPCSERRAQMHRWLPWFGVWLVHTKVKEPHTSRLR